MEIGSIENLPNRGEVITRSTGGQNFAPGDRVLGQVVAWDGGCGCEYCSLRITNVVAEQCNGSYCDKRDDYCAR